MTPNRKTIAAMQEARRGGLRKHRNVKELMADLNAPRKRKPMKITDAERLDWMEKAEGFALVSDDAGHWAVVSEGVQNFPDKHPADINTVFLIRKKEWKPSVREAIDAAIKEYGRDGPYATKQRRAKKRR